MESFLKEVVKWDKFELLIDTKIFSKDVVLKSAYVFLDKGYFFFKTDWENILLQFTSRDKSSDKPEDVIADFSDCLLETVLRDKLEKDNKTIRETIVEKAINWPLDASNFVSLDTDNIANNSEQNQVDFDKDIDEILKEIENDPDLKIDEEEIEKILKEIEEETESEVQKPKLTLDPDAIKKAKKDFKK